MKIRILTKPSKDGNPSQFDAELFWEEKKFRPVEVICSIDGKSLLEFQKDWERFLRQVLPSNIGKKELREKISKKANALEQIVFGKKTPPWKEIHFSEEILIQTDPEFTFFPWEILTTHKGFFYEWPVYRGIRSEVFHFEPKSKNGFLLIENPIREDLIPSVKKEGSVIREIWKSQSKTPIKTLKPDHLKTVRFWEEISEASYLHYAGHSLPEGIPFPKENRMIGDEIGKTKLSNLKIVFLNSCYSAHESKNTTGLAANFLKAGAEFVLGFLTPVETEVAELTSKIFWTEYLKTKSAKKAFERTKFELNKSDNKYQVAELSFLCFAPLEEKKYPPLLSAVFVTVLIGLFLFGWNLIREKEVFPFDKREMKAVETDKVENTFEQTKTKTNLSPPSRISDNPLTNRINLLTDQNFQRQIKTFLKEDHPLLDSEARHRLVLEILETEISEDRKFYEFKRRSGLEE
ncbi:hypothetical protein LPTSP3_g22510 [Leptospira kobayashii]|uniref:CHAT domain-containing protein n=1 Tax=Leptospira kobayashii TaxID=1917830 RepID=A0ABN6KH26_9LEPT|nr:CHAT domain-containing protein [Leptospira kobayashii]BDA79321.1 hypothetical protein LPTSP3_g22510 [Leptospira kobayashii]